MNKFVWIIVAVLILGSLGFYFLGSDNGGLLNIGNSSEKNLQPPALPE